MPRLIEPPRSLRIAAAAALVTVALVPAAPAQPPAAAKPLVFACQADNDLYRAVEAGGRTCPRFPDARDAIAAAPAGAGLLILADGYPAATVELTAELFSRAAEKKLRVYVEYPSLLPDVAVGKVERQKFGPWGVLWERGVVASDFFGAELPPQSIVMVHDCHYVPVGAGNPHLVLARVAGYDRAALGLPKETAPLLFQLPQRDVLVATTKLSQFVTGRYAPTDAWRAVWRGILGWLQPDAAPPRLAWTPTVRASYDRAAQLPPDAQREAVRRGSGWFLRSGLLVDPQWQYREHRENELKPVLWPDWKPGDGSRGILEGYMTRIRYDGRQGVSLSVRSDCNAESAMGLALGAAVAGEAAQREAARRLIHSTMGPPLVDGPRADPQNPNYGLIGWSLGSRTTYYGDDNARTLLAAIAVAAGEQDDEMSSFIVRGILANFRLTGPQGFRPAVLDENQVTSRGWRHYRDTNTVQLSPHFESWIWATYLWLFRQTQFAPLKERTREGLGRMMAAYPQGWYAECGRREADLARMLLPLAWLVRVDDTPEHRRWLRRIADDLLASQDASGAIRQRVTEPVKANELYGTGEAPVVFADGDPATDLLYTVNFAAIGLHEAAAATGDETLRRAADRTAEFLVRCQARSETHPELDGAWFRSFDFRRWEYYGSDADLGWGVWTAETGWTQGWITTTLALRELHTSLWEHASHADVREQFQALQPAMVPHEPGEPQGSRP